MILYWILTGLLAILILSEFTVLFTPVKTQLKSGPTNQKVSILMVVRNEATSIENSVRSLLSQSHSEFELLISDDFSTDETPEILRRVEEDPRIRCFYSAFEVEAGSNAKAQHLDYLMKESKHDIIAVTDGDCQYPITWLETMLANKPETGIISGTTGIYNSTYEDIDWIVNIGRVAVLNRLGFQTTAIGNNMLFDRKAYEATEGWKSIAKSITEDHELNRQIVNGGFESKVLFNKKVLARAEKEGFPGIFVQRRRWMRGAFKLSLSVVLILLLRLMVLPLLLTLGIMSFVNPEFYPQLTTGLISSYIAGKAIGDIKLIASLGIKFPLPVLGYQLNAMIQSFILALYFIFTPRVKWKGRTY